jgi:hypothetical protein
MTDLNSLNLSIRPSSLFKKDDVEFGFSDSARRSGLVILAPAGWKGLASFEGETVRQEDKILMLCRLTIVNAIALSTHLPWLQPRLLGLQTSAGLGDRLGLATPGHVRAIRATHGKIAPIFAQQSMREMKRTGRTPQQVLSDATWGIFSEGWHKGFGADADHLKTVQDIDECLVAGFTFFTFDPGDHVDNRAETASLSELRELAGKLPVEIRSVDCGLKGQRLRIEGLKFEFDEATLLKSAVKYGNAIAHVASMYHHLVESAGNQPFELEISIDETDQPTTHHEHAYIVHELQRLGVKWVSLAPRYIGRFEKGVDYIGDPAKFEADLAGHAAIARHYGPYKLSLHSGSDKFSIYPAVMRQTQGLVHLKTAGTSYLEALRTIAELDANFIKEIYTFACQHYENDKSSYHVSAKLSRAPLPESVSDWAGLLGQFDAREILHVTFGSVLQDKSGEGDRQFHERIIDILKTNAEAYASNLEKHFTRHLTPFITG